MLRNTFIHLPGTGPQRERALWDEGILDCYQFLAAAEEGVLPARTAEQAVPVVRQSLDAVGQGDARFFKPLLHFPQARLDQARIDLRFVLASLGYRDGLKMVERSLGLKRDPAIQGVDGFEAVRLWHRFRRGDRGALEKLVLYNLTDVVNLVELTEATMVSSLMRSSLM